MKFGRLESLAGVDFTLPADLPATDTFLSGLPAPSGPPIIRIGTPRWADKSFVGTLYPPATPARQYLRAYGEQLDTIELNATYYRADAATIGKWAKEVPERFRFCPKLSKIISHQLQLVDVDEATARFLDAIRSFGDRLGPAWLLLPDSFGPDRFALLERFIERWPKEIGLGVELRHPAWFERGGEVAFDLFEARNVVSIITDTAGRRDVIHQRVTSSTVILRFVGNALHPSDFERIDAWVRRLADWTSRGVTSVFIFLHQPDEALNLPIASRAITGLKAKTEADLTPIREFPDPDGMQLSF